MLVTVSVCVKTILLGGFCCKEWWGRKKPGPDFSLGGNLEEALHKSHLPLNAAFAYSFNLPFSHHMHRLITPDCSTCRLKTEETEPGIDAPFDEPMVLLDEVVEIFTLSKLSAVGECSFFLQLLDHRRIGLILIDVDHSRR
jgi:hypothetical protein